MKKIFALLTAAILTLAITGCGEETETIKKKKNGGATLEADMNLAYISEKPNARTRNMKPILQVPEGVLLVNTNSEAKVRVNYWNVQTGEVTEVERPTADKRYGQCTAFRLSGDRTGIMFERSYASHWDLDVEAIIEVYDAQMNYLETIDIPVLEGDQRTHYSTDWASGTDYLLFEYYSFDSDEGIKAEAYNLETGEVTDFTGQGYNVVSGASGAAYTFNYNYGQYYISRINVQSGRLEQITFEKDLSDTYFNYITGSGEYELYAFNSSGVTGLKISGNTGVTEKVLSMDASDLTNSHYSDISVAASPDGRFVIRDSEDLWVCHKRTEEEMKGVQSITLAGVNLTGDLKNVVINYNRTHTDYHIFMVDYMDYINEDHYFNDGQYTNSSGGSNTLYGVLGDEYDNATETDAAVALFRQDLLNGIVPDIICTNNLPYAQFANKGLFLDMKELMDKDERFNPDDYLMNFFDSMKYQGQQQTIAFSFYVNTIIGETETVGDKQGRTADEYQTMLQNIPEDLTGFGYTKDQYRDEFLTWMQNGFLNTETKTCSFDAPAFASLLEIGNGLMTEDEWWKMIHENEAATGVYSLWFSDMEKNAALTVRSFAKAQSYHENYAGEHDFRDITLVGFPTESGNGGMFTAPYQLAINAMSAYPEEIWDIFMGMLGEEAQRSYDLNTTYNSFPVLRSALKEDLEVVTKAPGYYYYKDGMNKSIGSIPMEEQDFLLDYIEHISTFYYADPTVSDMIREEADMYFAGDQTAQEAAAKIQSRASLYISEQY